MCLIAFAIGLQPGLPLWLASNRDEVLDRPTQPLDRWRSDDGAEVLGGRDLRDGGTWLGISPAGRVAWLTNVREAVAARGARSRGELVTRWLQGRHDAAAFAADLDPGAYGGFNLVIGDLAGGHWCWIGNRHPQRPHAPQSPALFQRTLAPGLYGLSNASLDTPWPKTQRLRSALAASPAHDEALARALTDTTRPADDALPRTGVPLEMERALASPFVQMPERGYGTRSSTLLRIESDRHGLSARMDEWQHDAARKRPVLHPASHRQVRLELLRSP